MAQNFYAPLLYTAVQALLPARCAESRQRNALTARRSAYAVRCFGRGFQAHFLIFTAKIIAMWNYYNKSCINKTLIFVYFCCTIYTVINLSYFLPLFFFKMFLMIKADDKFRLLFSVTLINSPVNKKSTFYTNFALINFRF